MFVRPNSGVAAAVSVAWVHTYVDCVWVCACMHAVGVWVCGCLCVCWLGGSEGGGGGVLVYICMHECFLPLLDSTYVLEAHT